MNQDGNGNKQNLVDLLFTKAETQSLLVALMTLIYEITKRIEQLEEARAEQMDEGVANSQEVADLRSVFTTQIEDLRNSVASWTVLHRNIQRQVLIHYQQTRVNEQMMVQVAAREKAG